ncbi:DUF421 domain-containing protein [Parasphingorhabdus cellanae]|uniref:DUF421 domain-containing protein n=1 Tax=Parasphingorhabdus cellanae TaxID=2806553 RepID=A0ABX7T1N4_9SPHN|nr:YetF domain-containing protein [Parasphingorhabdus cellanae]QTD54695.1 DUF421 domain-containing protein [Parasphingorhabdus cellanae]
MFGLEPAWDTVLRGSVLGIIAFVWIIILVRMVGLRSFSKMTSFDFVVTVAMGSLLATAATMTSWSDFFQTLVAIIILFLAQYIISRLRKNSDRVESAIDNNPVLLMQDGVVDESALTRHRVSRADLIAKLREANVLRFSDVRAVVLEATGDISVLHGETMDDILLEGVEGR